MNELYQELPVGVFELAADGQFVDGNAALLQILGVADGDELRRLSINDLYADIIDRERLEVAMAATDVVRNFEFPLRRRDGDLAWVSLTLATMTSAGGRRAPVNGLMQDISERRAGDVQVHVARRQLADIAEDLRLLLQSSGEGIIGVDTDLRCTFINPAGARLLGYEPNQLLGLNIHTTLHHHRADGSEYPQADCPMWKTVRTGTAARIPDEVLWCRDGTPLPVDYSTQPMIRDGVCVGAVVTFVDAGQRRRVEQRLQKRSRQQGALVKVGRAALEGAGYDDLLRLAVTCGSDGTAAPYACVLLVEDDGDYRLGPQVGLTDHASGILVPRELAAFSTAVLERRTSQMVPDWSREPRLRAESLIVRAYPVSSSLGVLLEASDRIVGVLTLHHPDRDHFGDDDVEFAQVLASLVGVGLERSSADRALRQSEERYRRIVETAQEGIWLFGDDSRTTFVNRSMAAMLGYEPAEMLGRHMSDFVDPGEWVADDPGLALLHNAVDHAVDFRFQRRDGTALWVLAAANRVRADDDSYAGSLVMVTDITDRKKMEENLHANVARLREVDEQRRLLLSRVAHAQEEERRRIAADIHDDAVQVMSAAHLRMEVLRRQLDGFPQQDSVGQLMQTVAATMARLRSLLFELSPPSLQTHGVATAVRLYLRQTDGAELQSSVEESLSTPPSDRVATVFYRIAQEAITNARKHSQASHLLVQIIEGIDGYMLAIADDGPYQPDRLLESRPGHLGIAMMRERAEAAGGWCAIRSMPEHGTVVVAWVPERTQNGEAL